MYGDISRLREVSAPSFLAVFCLWIILRGQALSRRRKGGGPRTEDIKPPDHDPNRNCGYTLLGTTL
jgi:hypothetical protein